MTERISLEGNRRWSSVRASRAPGEFSRLTVKVELMRRRPGRLDLAGIRRTPTGLHLFVNAPLRLRKRQLCTSRRHVAR
jgi:hypothetical protein